MYGIDINFLNDRAERATGAIVPTDRAPGMSTAGKKPLLIGAAVAIAACASVGGYWLILQNNQKSLASDNAVLDSRLAELQQKLAQVDTVRQQTVAIDAEVQALAGVFERIRPWSAIVRDVQGRVPNRTQILSLVQTASAQAAVVAVDPAAAPSPTGSVAGGLTLTGNACSFDDVNDFMLTLKDSPFLMGDSIKITSATLGEIVPGYCPGGADNGDPLELVSYTITSDIKSIPPVALLNELNRQQESTGLAARIRALQATGAIE